MSTNGYSLPYAENLDIYKLSQLFAKKATSYKLIFFYSILEILRRRFFDASEAISLQEINIEMLVHAWYPHSVFGLSFGYQDTITEKLDKLDIKLNKPLLKVTQNDKQMLREIITEKLAPENYQLSSEEDLRRYVPFRLIRPFFPELKGIADYKVNAKVAQMSRAEFNLRKPLYKFSDDEESILIHPEWVDYIKENYSIVHGWTVWNWLLYMQGKNSNSPGIANKMFPPLEKRNPMSEQRKYWRAILKDVGSIECIYSGTAINSKQFSLDHYLPWTFVAHNNLWNLVPVPKNINSAKSNRIPDEVYLDKFIQIQYLGVTISKKFFSEEKWQSMRGPRLIEF